MRLLALYTLELGNASVLTTSATGQIFQDVQVEHLVLLGAHLELQPARWLHPTGSSATPPPRWRPASATPPPESSRPWKSGTFRRGRRGGLPLNPALPELIADPPASQVQQPALNEPSAGSYLNDSIFRATAMTVSCTHILGLGMAQPRFDRSAVNGASSTCRRTSATRPDPPSPSTGSGGCSASESSRLLCSSQMHRGHSVKNGPWDQYAVHSRFLTLFLSGNSTRRPYPLRAARAIP